MKELDDFTVERLEKLIHLDGSGCVVYDAGVVGALARIALAAKTAEPLRVEIQMDDAYLKKHLKELTRWRSPTEMMSMPEIEANSPELPDGWKLVPIDLINDLRNAAHFEKASYAASFGSHIDTGRWKDEYEQLTTTCKAVDDLLAPPTTEK